MNELQVIKNFSNLSQALNANREFLDTKINKRQKIAFYYRISMVVIASGITLVLGLNLPNSNKIALILSSILTILTTLDQFERFTTKHIALNRRMSDILKILFDLDFYLTENNQPTQEKFDEFKERYFLILDKAVNEMSEMETTIKESVKKLGNTSK